jgi:hypothetical protein
VYVAQSVPPIAEKRRKRRYGYSIRPIETLTAKRTPGTKRPNEIRSDPDRSSSARPLATRSSSFEVAF